MKERGMLSDKRAKADAKKVVQLGKKMEAHEMAEMKHAHKHHEKHHKETAKHHHEIAKHHSIIAKHHEKIAKHPPMHAGAKHHEGAKHHRAHHKAK